MQLNDLTSIMHISATWAHIFLPLAATILLFIKHHTPKDRSQWFVVSFFFLSTLAALVEVLITFTTQHFHSSYRLFDFRVVLTGYITLYFLVAYYLELMRPHWLNLKRLLLLFSPAFVCIIILLYCWITGRITRIYSISEIHHAWGEINFIVRFALSSMPLLYMFWVMSLCMRGYAGYKCPRPMMRGTLLLSAALCVTFFLSRGLQLFTAYMVHEGLFIALGVLIIYVEHYERLHIPLEKVRSYYVEKEIPKTTDVTISHAAARLKALMEDPTVWQDSELTGNKLALLVGTNRTYTQQAAKELGFASLIDMIHRRRIEYICEQLRQDPTASIQDLFYEAGYRSRTTGWRHFNEIVGYTPSEFIERNIHPKYCGRQN